MKVTKMTERTKLMYTANTMKNFRYSLNRILKSKGHQYDIIHKNSLSFKKSQKAFLDSQKELKSLGKGEIKSAPKITEEDPVKLYNHAYMDPKNGAEHLQRKVQFDIRLYFCRRGCENMEKMLKDDFEIKVNEKTDELYVVKVRDEMTKNHREAEQIVSGIMPENKTDPMCPVQSFKKYLQHLHPENKYMWQKPLEHPHPSRPNIWYSKQHIGKNPLAKFMSEVSKNCKLSQKYSNHSIRVTGCTVLTRCQFSHSEIMSVSGHKSVQSLAVYQKTKDKQKIEMGKALFQSMTRDKDDIDINRKNQIAEPPKKKALPAPTTTTSNQNIMAAAESQLAIVPVQAKENVAPQIILFEPNFDDDVSDLDLLSALCGIQENVSNTTTVSNTSNVVTTAPRAMFANCQIGSININITKK